MKKFLGRVARSLPGYRELLQTRDALAALSSEVAALRTITAVRYFESELRSNPRYSDARMLQRHSLQVNSQNGEDGIIHEIFRRIGVTNRVFAEIGVGDGTENNTAYLLSQGWTGFWIDGRDAFLGSIRGRADLERSLTYRVARVDRDNVAALFKAMQAPIEFDLLSVDIDQNTYYVWQALREYRPRVVVVEYNAALPPDVDWKVNYSADRSWNGTQNFGASLKALERLGDSLGYTLVGCDLHGVNAFFVRKELVGNQFAAPYTAEHHYQPPRYAQVFTPAHAKSILDRGGSSG